MDDGTGNTYGFPNPQWEKAKEEAKAILRACARKEMTIWYSDLTSQINAIKFNPHERPFFAFLGQISSEEDAEGKGMLTALVVHKPPGDCKPGPGFYELAQSLGKDVTDLDLTWIREVKKVYRSYS